MTDIGVSGTPNPVPHIDWKPTGNELVQSRIPVWPYRPRHDLIVCRGCGRPWAGHGRFCSRLMRWLTGRR